jgi:tetratricopeptide (TPR) repeat protein
MTTRSIALTAALVALAGCAAGAAKPVASPAAPRPDPAAAAYAARQAGDFAKAEAIASAEVEAGRAGARLYFERGVARRELGKLEEALADFRKVNEIQEDPQALLLAGSIEMRLARWADAEKGFARAVVLAPKNARAWASLAQARIASKDLAGAAAAHATAASIAPEDPYVREVGGRLALATAKAAEPASPGAETAPVPAAASAGAAPPATEPAVAPKP